MDVPHYWTAEQVGRLLDQLADDNRYPARTAALIMWRSGLRVSEALNLEWRDLNYLGKRARWAGECGGNWCGRGGRRVRWG